MCGRSGRARRDNGAGRIADPPLPAAGGRTATTFLFRHRFWIFVVIFWGGFSLSAVDHVTMGAAIVHLFAPSLDLDSAAGTLALRAVFAAATTCILASAALRTWAAAYLRTVVVHDTALHAEALVASGPYRYTRNPLYLGGLLLAIGFGVMASRLGFLVIVGAVTWLELALIRSEEALLLAAHPDTFPAFRAAVPRFFPSLMPRLPRSSAAAQWPQAFAGEAMFWIFAAGGVALTITLDVRWTVGLIVAALAIHLVVVVVSRRARRAPA